ncbi:ankyrin-1-like isoform X2 [Stylophora pistillata]|uniref:ankyrin-1-like isoform X2 n=1 Tax=Stylophora pistillata TaxID=50429 RepID=UPI000C043726|nr:ankyrin-1-like isoform X2 [Stylophora pistillata]
MTLRKLAEEGNVEELRRLLKRTPNPKELLETKFGQNKMTALHIAIEKGHEEVVKLLLENEADPRATDHYGRTALHVATSIQKENIYILDLILSKDVDVNAQEENRNTPVKLAAEKGHLKTVKWLISKGANVDEADKVDNTTLHFAAKKGHDQVLELLLTEVADRTIGKQNKDKKTALHFAVESKSERCVALLLKHGAGICIESKNEQGRTPLDLANDDPNQNIIDLLRNPKKAHGFLVGPKSNMSKALLGKGGSVEPDSCPYDAAHQEFLKKIPEAISQLSSDGATPIQVFNVSGDLNFRKETNVTVKDKAMASIGSGSQVNITQPYSASSTSHQQHSGGSQFKVEVSDDAHAVIGDSGMMNVNLGQSRTPSNAGSRDSSFNFPGDQGNRDPHEQFPPETGTPMENSDSQGPAEVSAALPPSEEPPGEVVRGALFRSFQGEPPLGEGDKSLAQPIQEEFPLEKDSEGLTHPVEEDSPPGKDEHIVVQEEQSQAKPVQEESPGDKDSGTLSFPVQDDSPPGKVHQTLHQLVQEVKLRGTKIVELLPFRSKKILHKGNIVNYWLNLFKRKLQEMKIE